MADGVSQRGLADQLGVSEAAVRKALKSGRIKRLPDGSIDVERARRDWGASTDPARSRVRTSAKVRANRANPDPGSQKVRTQAEARAAVHLITQVLREEGMPDDGSGLDFGKVRTAELILKARQRHLDQAEQAGRLVCAATVRSEVFNLVRVERDAWMNWPARVAPLIAAQFEIDGPDLTREMEKHVREHLTERAGVVERKV